MEEEKKIFLEKNEEEEGREDGQMFGDKKERKKKVMTMVTQTMLFPSQKPTAVYMVRSLVEANIE